MCVSRAIVVIMRGNDVEIYPSRLIERGKSNVRHLAAVTVK
ncbi:MAG: hypothetical protein QOC81_4074 [Thermoanaerobaculia bacterium]|jgi:hypothetical protein|nr:hypothetical protein [Thermoanaerobaculia bacterium]